MFQPFAMGVLSLCLLLSSGATHAAATCTWESTAARYGVNPYVLYAIAQQESSLNPSAVNKNLNGSIDFGLTQINSQWLPHLKQFGINAGNLMDPCTNLHAGAYILALSVRRHGNTWNAIGAYHSSTPSRRDRYARSIYQRLRAMGQAPAE
jgi:soluble lytic murein transglycosylase-like protein